MTSKQWLHRIIERHDTTAGRAFDIFIQILIIVSLVSFSIETLPDLSPDTSAALRIIEIIAVSIFTLEYALRVYVSSRKAKFIFSFYGMVDLLAILPFYIASGQDLLALRALRLMRIFKLLRYGETVDRFRRAFSLAGRELILFGSASLVVLYLAAVGIYFFEHKVQPDAFSSVFHALWWAVATFTTVGYGDVYPITLGGRIFTFFVLVIGLGIVALPTAIIASTLTKVRHEEKSTGKSADTENY